MNPTLNAYALPTLVEPGDMAGGTVVIIDVLRASTTIVHALEAGATEVIPCLEVDDARAAAAELPEGSVVLGGERAGLVIERVLQQSGTAYQLNVQALTARENWRSAFALPLSLGAEPLAPERLADELRKSVAGRRLAEIGMDDDVLTAAHVDRFASVPELDPAAFRIRLP